MFAPPDDTRRWARLWKEPEFALAQLILWLFVALTSLQVIMRYVFNAPLTWPEELTQILLVWMTFIAAVGLSRKGLHIRVEFVEELMGRRGRHAVELVFNLLTLVFLAFLAVGGWEMYQQLQFERTPALRININIVYAVVPLSAAAMFFTHFVQLIGNFAGIFRDAPDGP